MHVITMFSVNIPIDNLTSLNIKKKYSKNELNTNNNLNDYFIVDELILN